MSNPSTPFIDRSVDLTGASQALFADVGFNGNQERTVHNPSAANPIAINPTGGAAVINGKGCIQIAAGGTFTGKWTNATTVIGTAGQKATALER
jgi:hypothetical protein